MFIGIRCANFYKISKYIIYMGNDNLSVFLQNNIVYILLALLILYFIFNYKEYFKGYRPPPPPPPRIPQPPCIKKRTCDRYNKKGNCDGWIMRCD